MKQKAKQTGSLLFILTIFLIPFKTFELHENEVEAATRETKTLGEILEKRQNYINRVSGRTTNKLVNILIVPGHDDEHTGAGFGTIREVDLNRALAKKLFNYLAEEKGINPVLSSTASGYNPIFERYFNQEESKIKKFIKDSKKSFSKKIIDQDLVLDQNTFHNAAPGEMIQRLYGINRWVNNQDFDLVIHIHFNDYAGRKWNKEGKYDGFSIYTPSPVFENHDLSRVLADSVFEELQKIRPVSNLESEKEGVIEDNELIAVGANESLDAGAILVEYGYIYEPILNKIETRNTSLDYFAYATYKGVKKMLNEVPQEKEKLEVQISKNKTSTANIVWQFQKTVEGTYPPKGKSLRDCPISGYFGGCSSAVN